MSGRCPGNGRFMRIATRPTVSVSLALLGCVLLPPWGWAEEELIGSKAKEWEVTDWLNSKPLTLKDQAGKVVLVRWWTAPGCPYCAATAPALNEFDRSYKDKGLVIVGF